MNPEAEQPEPTATEQVNASAVTAAAAETKRRAGVPVWRIGKPDAFLAAATDVARSAVEGITAASTIGTHLGAKSEGDRLVTHLFESRMPGYQGWQWFAVLTRNSRSKVVTISELGLLPSEESILAPEWVPWAERVRPEDAQDEEALDAAYRAAGVEAVSDAAEPHTEEADADEPDTEEADSDEPDTDEPGTEESAQDSE